MPITLLSTLCAAYALSAAIAAAWFAFLGGIWGALLIFWFGGGAIVVFLATVSSRRLPSMDRALASAKTDAEMTELFTTHVFHRGLLSAGSAPLHPVLSPARSSVDPLTRARTN